ncbi:MAG: hypothetical protein IJL52_10935 [Clostridia bacterium]|nr:hypothetical protein [Clostridia bacterium]
MKKALSVFLAVLMIAGCMAISFSASAAETITITVKEPKIGETADTGTISISPVKYAKYVQEIEYFEGDKNGAIGTVTTPFEAGKSYYARVRFDIANADWNDFYNATIVFNGQEIDKSTPDTDTWHNWDLGTDVYCYFGELKAPAEPEPEPAASVCPWCGGDHSNGFFQAIIGWFHNILASLFGAKF